MNDYTGDEAAALEMTKAWIISGAQRKGIQELRRNYLSLYDEGAMSESRAGALASNVYLKSLGAADLPPDIAASMEADFASSSVVDTTQFIMTGDLINLDGNPFTKF